MINFEKLKIEGNEPIYVQLVSFVKQGLAAGEIESGDELPSRRVVSALLGINPNTVQKAYAMLEDEDLISSRPGAKSCISAGPGKIAEIRAILAEESGRRAIEALKAAGFTKEEALSVIEKYWEEE